jgi:hypothetical protein
MTTKKNNQTEQRTLCDCGEALTAGDLALQSTMCAACMRKEQAEPNDLWAELEAECEGDTLDAGEEFVLVSSHKPRADIYIRFMPDISFQAHTYVQQSGGEGRESIIYVAFKKVACHPTVEDHFRKTSFFFGVDHAQNLFLWPLRYSAGDRIDHRVSSAITCRKTGIENWIQVHWNKNHSIVQAKAAEGTDLPEPIFPVDKKPIDWLKAAFPQNQIIGDMNHTIIKQLRGLAL